MVESARTRAVHRADGHNPSINNQVRHHSGNRAARAATTSPKRGRCFGPPQVGRIDLRHSVVTTGAGKACFLLRSELCRKGARPCCSVSLGGAGRSRGASERRSGGDGELRPTALLLSVAASVKRHGFDPLGLADARPVRVAESHFRDRPGRPAAGCVGEVPRRGASPGGLTADGVMPPSGMAARTTAGGIRPAAYLNSPLS
jgi:hypothetical protein